MARALIVHASRHGATAGIAERIGEVLDGEGIDTRVEPAANVPDPFGFDACVVGGAVYMGSWLKEGVEYLERYARTLSAMPVWLFSSGPLPSSTAGAAPKDGGPDTDPLTSALGPADGPGSGGRKRILALSAAIHVREHRVFQGAFDPSDPPRAMSERLVRMMPSARGLLPPGDFRPWDLIDAWARDLAAAVKQPVAPA